MVVRMSEELKDAQTEWAELKKQRLIWVLDNAQEISKQISVSIEKNPRKINCSYVDMWEWEDDREEPEIVTIYFNCHFKGPSINLDIHENDLDEFIKEYLDTKGMEMTKKMVNGG